MTWETWQSETDREKRRWGGTYSACFLEDVVFREEQAVQVPGNRCLLGLTRMLQLYPGIPPGIGAIPFFTPLEYWGEVLNQMTSGSQHPPCCPTSFKNLFCSWPWCLNRELSCLDPEIHSLTNLLDAQGRCCTRSFAVFIEKVLVARGGICRIQ